MSGHGKKRVGHGTWTSGATGAKYVGQWNDVFNGSGSYTYADGTQYKGTWSMKRKDGWGKVCCLCLP